MFCILVLAGNVWINPCEVTHLKNQYTECYIGITHNNYTLSTAKCKDIAAIINKSKKAKHNG